MKKQLVLFLALALCLGLTACGDTESDDTQSGYETVMDMEFLDGMWSIDGTAKLYFDSTEGFYAYRTRWGLGGRGEFELSEASGRPMIFFNGLLYNFLLRDDGVLLPNRNGEGSGLTIHRNTFLRDDEAEIVEWDISNWDGMWQNALGETIVINSSLMQYIACSPDYSMSGTMNDEGEGMGLYFTTTGRAPTSAPVTTATASPSPPNASAATGTISILTASFTAMPTSTPTRIWKTRSFMKTNTPPSISGTTTA